LADNYLQFPEQPNQLFGFLLFAKRKGFARIDLSRFLAPFAPKICGMDLFKNRRQQE